MPLLYLLIDSKIRNFMSATAKFCYMCNLVFFVIQSWPFQKPVSSKQVPDYYDVVKTPIDLLTIRQVCLPDVFISFSAVQMYYFLCMHVRYMFCLFMFLWFSSQQVQGHAYQNRDEFMEHVKMMHRNSVIYNGTAHLHCRD